MSRPCSICGLGGVGAVNEALAQGQSVARVARDFDLSPDALLRHARSHLRSADPHAHAPAHADPLDELVTALRERALAGDPAISREYRLGLLAQQAAARASAPTRDLASEPEWIALRTRVLEALEPYPDARQAIAAALRP
jgi:transposase-like protein